MSEKILLIDGHSILNRAFYGLPDLTNSEGKHTGAVYGFLNIIFKILEEEGPDYLTVAFDVHAPTFRHGMFPEYKGTRKAMPKELREQVPLLQEVLGAMGICIVQKAGYEADDLLGTLAKRCEAKGMEVTILSGDRDLLQLATAHILVRVPKTVKGKTVIEDYREAQVLEKYQVTPPQIIELKALMGDTADNIPGIPGVGEKTATKIIVEFCTIENAYAHLEEIKPNKARESLREHYDLAVLSKKLATIQTDAPIMLEEECARVGDFYTPEAYEYFRKLEFKNLLSRFASTPAPAQSWEMSFAVCTELAEAEEIFREAAILPAVGLQTAGDEKRLFGVALALEKQTFFLACQGFLTEGYLKEKVKELAGGPLLCTMDVKGILKQISLPGPAGTFDASIAAYLLNPLKSAYPYEDLAGEYLQSMLPSQGELIGKLSLSAAFLEKPEEAGQVWGFMAGVALAVQPALTKALKEQGMERVFLEMEMPLAFTLHAMEQEGILVKPEELQAYGEQLLVRIQELEEKIYIQAGEKFNINSPKQLGGIIFEKMQLPGGKKTKTGYSTAADVLERLAPQAPIIQDILEYRQLTKLKSTYADGLYGCIGEDGRIHSTFHQTITATGRISSTEPNLQNIPVRMELGRLIRKVFVPKEGCVFLDADYSQIELRVLAHMSGDEKLIQAYQEAQDIHRITASQVFHVPFEEVTALQRRNAKAVNFGIVYGISSFGLSQDLSITKKEAAEYIQRYFDTYPKIKGFLDGLVAQGKKDGYVATMFGRRRPIPELKSSNFMQRSFGERIAMNSPIQGSAADIIKIAMNRVHQRLKDEHLKSRLLLQVHDELLIETYIEELPAVSALLEEEMKGAAQLLVSLEVDMHTGENWYEAK